MHYEIFNLSNAFAKTAADTTRQLVELNTRTYERLAKRQVELASDFVETAVKQGVSHYMAAQRELAEDYAFKAQAANTDTVRIISQAQEELNSYLEQQLPAAMEQVRAVVKDVTRETADNARSAANKRAA
jgi:hypothetical protein